MEEWKQIKDFPDYEISSLGRVRSNKRKKSIILKPAYYSNGYTFVHLCNKDGKKYQLIHRLVLSTFCPCENMENLQVNHLNCIRDDNRLENLEWCTPQENRKYRDEKLHTPKAETIEVNFLNGEKMIFNSITECANYFNVSRKAINHYLEADNIRSDRKVQAYFRRLGRTSELNQ